MRDLLGEGILDLRYYWFTETTIDGIPVVVTRTGWTSEVGYEVYLLRRARRAPSCGRRSWRAGEPYDIRPTGPVDIRRIEGGIFNWGADMTYDNNPYEMGLDRLVDLDVDCVARDALRRIAEQRRDPPDRGRGDGWRALPDPQLHQVARKPRRIGRGKGHLRLPLAPARAQHRLRLGTEPSSQTTGTRLDVESEWGSRTATVVPMPFIDPEKTIPVS